MRVYISEKALKQKPEDCTVCPICDVNDDCLLIPKWFASWDEQYKHCPLVEDDRND